MKSGKCPNIGGEKTKRNIWALIAARVIITAFLTSTEITTECYNKSAALFTTWAALQIWKKDEKKGSRKSREFKPTDDGDDDGSDALWQWRWWWRPMRMLPLYGSSFALETRPIGPSLAVFFRSEKGSFHSFVCVIVASFFWGIHSFLIAHFSPCQNRRKKKRRSNHYWGVKRMSNLSSSTVLVVCFFLRAERMRGEMLGECEIDCQQKGFILFGKRLFNEQITLFPAKTKKSVFVSLCIQINCHVLLFSRIFFFVFWLWTKNKKRQKSL